MKSSSIVFVLTAIALTFAAPQYPYQYATPNPYLYMQPTFSDIYGYTTPYAIYGQNSVRIWPYVTGQYGQYGQYGYPYNTYNNGYSNSNGYNWYNSLFPYRQVYFNKK